MIKLILEIYFIIAFLWIGVLMWVGIRVCRDEWRHNKPISHAKWLEGLPDEFINPGIDVPEGEGWRVYYNYVY